MPGSARYGAFMSGHALGKPPWAEPAFLRNVQYADDRNLAARQSIYAYSERQADLPALVIDSLRLSGNEAVIDIGCGNGLYLAELARRRHVGPVAGLDLSPGMLLAARERARHTRLVAGDAARLPLRDAAIDVALAMHMLYHVPDPASAVAELRRVTRPGGAVVIGLNGDGHLAELRALVNAELARAYPAVGHVVTDLIKLDGAEPMLRRAFGTVTRHDLTGKLLLPGPRPAADYVLSLSLGQPPEDQDRLAAAVTKSLHIGERGVFTVTTHCGWLICT
jgi:SAM-dependent methyltransferase